MSPVFAMFGSWQDIMVVLVVGFIVFVIFGKRMPEFGRSLGKGIMEFKKGIKGLEDDPGDNYYAGNNGQQQQQQQQQPTQRPPQAEPPRPPQRITSAAPKFDEPPNPPAPPPV
ncbi:MAG TPA: twin-arginine translocase TatA/TatE family subunit [Gemmataceae bacterium]|nr:twin-arginine translocase TatA/TatE family subunit [Gemmataceae bacterium]